MRNEQAVQSKMERPEYGGAGCVCLLIRNLDLVVWQWLGKQQDHSISEGRHLKDTSAKRQKEEK